MPKFRFHALGLPHTVTSHEYTACAYTQKVLKFCKMMTALGHEVIHYGHEDSVVEATEHVTVTTNQDLEIAYGTYDWRRNFFKFAVDDHAHRTFHANSIKEIARRKQAHDFVLHFWGWGHKPIADAHPDLINVEPGIGYATPFARWRVYESHALRNAVNGADAVSACTQDWYHVVVPNYFDTRDFEFSAEKDDYMLYLGRVYSGKGVDIAVEVARHTGRKLLIAGQGNLRDMGYTNLPDNIVELGYADIETRKQLMSQASSLIIGSRYNEPFGGVQVEAMLSGTPVISPDWGAFAEYNVDGLTGYRCRSFGDFVRAVDKCDSLDPNAIRAYAERFTLESVAPQYERYFTDVMNVYTGAGWYEI
jgi:glycosyltransferase involved in cell wall biosynthesis